MPLRRMHSHSLLWLLALLAIVATACANTPPTATVGSQATPAADDAPAGNAADGGDVDPGAQLPDDWSPFGPAEPAPAADDDTVSDSTSDDAADDESANEPATSFDNPPEFLAFAADASKQPGSVYFDYSFVMTIDGIQMKIDADGATDGTNAELVMDLRGMLSAFQPGGQAVPPEVEAMYTEPVRMVATPDALYVRWPAITAMVNRKESWISMSDMTESASTMPGLGELDPAAFTSFLYGAGSDVVDVGRREIDGVAVTGYSGTFGLGDVLARGTAEQQAELGDMWAELGVSGGTITGTVWASDDGLVRQMQMNMNLDDMDMMVAISFFDYGAEVSIPLPDPSDVMPASDIPGF